MDLSFIPHIDQAITPLSTIGLLTTFICGAIVGLERQLCGNSAAQRRQGA